MHFPELPFLPSPSADELGDHYLGRLARLVHLRRELEEDLNALGVDLLDRAIASTLKDCEANGAGRSARALVRRTRLRGDGTR